MARIENWNTEQVNGSNIRDTRVLIKFGKGLCGTRPIR